MARSKDDRQKPIADRTLRSLLSLQANASTARTLNLIAVWENHADAEGYHERPFFRNPVLNRGIVIKHRLRNDERDLFATDRTVATKVILPIDITNLRAGARSFFVGQRGYHDILSDILAIGGEAGQYDQALLAVLDELPSLDPFLMRERLKRAGYAPARCYFEITQADMTRMFQFVRQEVQPLIGMSFPVAHAQLSEMAGKLATKIMADAGDADLEPLRAGLGMDPAEFQEGIFCWKGFLYYKWLLIDLMPRLRPVSSEIARIRPRGPVSIEDKAYLASVSTRLGRSIGAACDTVRATLKIYDDAYVAITETKQPQAFRDFLITAPTLFYDLGEKLGAVQHIVSFWRFRFPQDAALSVSADELVDIFADFESGIATDTVALAA